MKRRGASGSMRVYVRVILLAVLLLLLGSHVSAVPQPGEVHFTAAGDFDNTANTGPVLSAIDNLDSDLTLALGDLSYGAPSDVEEWCNLVTSHVGAGYPFELLAGNHESMGENGHINDFSACLPNQLPGAVGTYGRQYYVDVPAADPIVRFIMISPGLTFPNGAYDYSPGSARYLWTAQAIDTARAAAIPWVVVGMHKPCITMGVYSCDPGADLFNMLLGKKVDLILSGHEHSYQRSKQIGPGAGCSTVVPGIYDSDCVVDSDSTFTQGAGSVAAIVGTGGRALYSVGNGDPETPYFAASSGSNNNPTYGVLDVTATETSLDASFVRGAGGTFADSFRISRSATQNVPPVASFSSSCTELACNFDGSGSSDSDGNITGYVWDFGDGSTGSGATATHTYAAAGSYTVGLTVTDNGGATGSTSKNVTPTGPPSTTYVSDQFTRTVTAGLGTAPTGGTWTHTGSSSNLSVSGGTGNLRVTAGSAIGAYLASVSAPSTDLRLSFGLDKPATGGGMFVSAYGRRIVGQGAYAGKVKVASTGAVSLQLIRLSATATETSIQAALTISGLTYAVGDALNLRMQVVGSSPTTISAKVWKAGSPEPTAWHRTATDSTTGLQAAGSVGVSPYLSGSATNSPITVKLDELTVDAP